MVLTFRQLEMVRALIRGGTVTEAARLLGISQPAVSRMLRHAEDRLGVALFARHRGRLRATANAWALYAQIEKVFGGLESVQRTAEGIREQHAWRLRVATIPSLGQALLPAVLQRLTSRLPQLRVGVQTLLNYEVASLVANDEADVGLVFAPPDYPELDSREFLRTSILCVMPEGSALAARPAIEIAALAETRLIVLRPDLPLGAVVAACCADHGLIGQRSIEVSQSSMACAMAAKGLGVALVDAIGAGRLEPGLVARSLIGTPEISARLLLPPGRRASRLVDRFVDELRIEAAVASDRSCAG